MHCSYFSYSSELNVLFQDHSVSELYLQYHCQTNNQTSKLIILSIRVLVLLQLSAPVSYFHPSQLISEGIIQRKISPNIELINKRFAEVIVLCLLEKSEIIHSLAFLFTEDIYVLSFGRHFYSRCNSLFSLRTADGMEKQSLVLSLCI